MIAIQKKKDSYGIYDHTGKIGWVTLYENPWHAANSYLKIELQNWETLISETLCRKLKALAGRPLQVMVDAKDTDQIRFLTAGGFVCKRRCYEVNACAADYIGHVTDVKCSYCFAGDSDYEACCRMMYRHYVDTHKGINPWTADYEAFCTKLPKTAVCAKRNDRISSLAFVENNEIAYVCGLDERHFYRFAQSLVPSMFLEYDHIFFESDDGDWAAMLLKSLFISHDDTAFCTYVLM